MALKQMQKAQIVSMKQEKNVLIFITEIVLTVLIFLTELIFPTELILTALVFLTGVALNVLIFLTEIVLTVLILFLTELVPTVLKVMSEKNIVIECNHSFILKLFRTFMDDNQLYMLLELVQGGELWSLLYEKKSLLPVGPYGGVPAPEARFYAGIVIETFRYIHSLGVSYRDLKPENLLIDAQVRACVHAHGRGERKNKKGRGGEGEEGEGAKTGRIKERI
jgi:serine/threonine protein kinase